MSENVPFDFDAARSRSDKIKRLVQNYEARGGSTYFEMAALRESLKLIVPSYDRYFLFHFSNMARALIESDIRNGRPVKHQIGGPIRPNVNDFNDGPIYIMEPPDLSGSLEAGLAPSGQPDPGPSGQRAESSTAHYQPSQQGPDQDQSVQHQPDQQSSEHQQVTQQQQPPDQPPPDAVQQPSEVQVQAQLQQQVQIQQQLQHQQHVQHQQLLAQQHQQQAHQQQQAASQQQQKRQARGSSVNTDAVNNNAPDVNRQAQSVICNNPACQQADPHRNPNQGSSQSSKPHHANKYRQSDNFRGNNPNQASHNGVRNSVNRHNYHGDSNQNNHDQRFRQYQPSQHDSQFPTYASTHWSPAQSIRPLNLPDQSRSGTLPSMQNFPLSENYNGCASNVSVPHGQNVQNANNGQR